MTWDELVIKVRDAIRLRGEQIGETAGWCGDLDAEYAEVAVDTVLDTNEIEGLPGSVVIGVSELGLLNFGAVVIDSRGESWTKDDEGKWYWCWYDFGMDSGEIALPAIVVWNGGTPS